MPGSGNGRARGGTVCIGVAMGMKPTVCIPPNNYPPHSHSHEHIHHSVNIQQEEEYKEVDGGAGKGG